MGKARGALLVDDLGDVVHRLDDALGEQVAGDEFDVVARGAHRHGELLAVEVAEKDNTTGDDIEGWLIMGNYAVTDSMGLTIRYSEEEIGTAEYDKFTISPSYVFTDSLSGLIEYSTYSVNAAGTDPGDLAAVEVIFTF